MAKRIDTTGARRRPSSSDPAVEAARRMLQLEENGADADYEAAIDAFYAAPATTMRGVKAKQREIARFFDMIRGGTLLPRGRRDLMRLMSTAALAR
jgi:hypothetical protein